MEEASDLNCSIVPDIASIDTVPEKRKHNDQLADNQ